MSLQNSPAGTCFIDFDRTLVQSRSSTPIPGVARQLAALRRSGWRTVLVTNQSGPAWRAYTGKASHPTVEEVIARIVGGLTALQWTPGLLLVSTFVSDDLPQYQARHAAARLSIQLGRYLRTTCEASADPAWRMPQTGMLERARALGFPGPYVMIGDNAVLDGGAALAFGAQFVRAEHWHARSFPALA